MTARPQAPDAAACADRVLALCVGRALSMLESRVLLALAGGDATRTELAERLGARPADLRCATRRLMVRGFVRRRHPGPGREMRLAVTARGLEMARSLVSAAAGPPGP